MIFKRTGREASRLGQEIGIFRERGRTGAGALGPHCRRGRGRSVSGELGTIGAYVDGSRWLGLHQDSGR